LNTNTATGAAICGRITAQYVSTRSTAANSRNSGTISASPGIMMPARMNQKTNWLPRKRIRDSAYPAMLQNTTANVATSVEITKLLKYQRRMLPAPITFSYASNVGFSIPQRTGTSVVSASGLSEVSIAHANGMIQSRANASSTPMQTPLNSRWRVITKPFPAGGRARTTRARPRGSARRGPWRPPTRTRRGSR
jgi:hypothetical protein